MLPRAPTPDVTFEATLVANSAAININFQLALAYFMQVLIYIPRVVWKCHDLVTRNRVRCKLQLVWESKPGVAAKAEVSRERQDVTAQANFINFITEIDWNRLQSRQILCFMLNLTLNLTKLTLNLSRYNNWHFSNQHQASLSASPYLSLSCCPSPLSLCSQANLLETSTEWVTVYDSSICCTQNYKTGRANALEHLSVVLWKLQWRH